MNYYEKFKNYFLKRGKKKNVEDLIIFFIIGIIIMLAANILLTPVARHEKEDTDTESNAVSTITLTYEEKIKQELVDVLSKIDGAGKVDVMISFKSGNEAVPAFNSNNTNRVTEENDGSGGKRVTNENTVSTNIVTTNEDGETKPFITKEINPEVNGVIVIAEGANNPNVKYLLSEAVKTVFNIPQHKVSIYPMEKNK